MTRQSFMNRNLLLTFIFLPIALLTLMASNKSVWREIYRNDFESGDRAGWRIVPDVSSTSRKLAVSSTPDGTEKVLGEFGSQQIILHLDNLPSHDSLVVSFDLLIIRSWDGNNHQFGPDVWELAVDGTTILHTTFSNTTYPQSFPGTYPSAANQGRTGAEVTDAYGYTWKLPGIFSGPMDAMYRITRTIAHTNDSTELSFFASLVDSPDEGLANESWALDNISVAVLETDIRPDSLRHPFIHISTGE